MVVCVVGLGCYNMVSRFWIFVGGLSGFTIYGLCDMDFWFRLVCCRLAYFGLMCCALRCSLLWWLWCICYLLGWL